MKLGGGTKWKLDRDLGEPEDDFFGLLEEDELPGSEVADGTQSTSIFSKLIGALITKSDEPQEEVEELDDLIIETPMDPRPQPGDLEQHIIRLPDSRQWEEFQSAEREATLFEKIEETRKRRFRASAWALWLSAALWAYLGFKYGSSYLNELTDPAIQPTQWMSDNLPGQWPQIATIGAGILAPVAGFLLTASSAALLLGGAYERRPMRAILGICGLIVLALLLSLAGQGFYLAALIVGLGAWIGLRALEWLMIQLGVY